MTDGADSIDRALRQKHAEGVARADALIFKTSGSSEVPLTDPPPGSFDNGASEPGPPPAPSMTAQIREAASFVGRFPGREVALEETRQLFS